MLSIIKIQSPFSRKKITIPKYEIYRILVYLQKIAMKKNFLILISLAAGTSICAQSVSVNSYFSDIKRVGEEPIEFINKALDTQDLIVFDDALHSAYEPFVFYNQLINSKSLARKINYIFLEVISTTAQPLIDSFLNSKTADSNILTKAFQDDYTGMGWTYRTYLDLFNTVWVHNQQLPDSLKIKIIGVNPPIYWEAIHTWKDYTIFQSSLKSRDYFMYLEILENMKAFKKNRKGLFFCNTRHAYKNIKNSKGELYWNTTTFFNQLNPGKVFSIRIHNVTLSLEETKKIPATKRKSTDGLNETVYKWIKMDSGRWDDAFALNSNKQIALPFKNTSFGRTPYVGNHMLDVAKGTTMADAYDALIFLAPLTDLHFSAQFNYIYNQQFKPELERRLRLLKGDEYDNYLKENNASDFEEFYKKHFDYTPISKNSFVKEKK